MKFFIHDAEVQETTYLSYFSFKYKVLFPNARQVIFSSTQAKSWEQLVLGLLKIPVSPFAACIHQLAKS